MRTSAAISKSETGALVSKCQVICGQPNVATNERPKCAHCGKLGDTIIGWASLSFFPHASISAASSVFEEFKCSSRVSMKGEVKFSVSKRNSCWNSTFQYVQIIFQTA